jgi:thiamine biosynthesis lipoprotein
MILTAAESVAEPTDAPGFTERTEWIMGTTLRIVLPADRADGDALFATCFAEVRRWNDLLSPWRDEAPLSRLSRRPGEWVELPDDVLDYVERAVHDAARTQQVFDITLAWQGSRGIEIDRAAGRARLPAGSGPLDPGGNGKGVALDAVAAILEAAGVASALVDFGGSSFLARGGGPGGDGWKLALTGADGDLLGVLRLRDRALSVSSTVQRDRGADGAVTRRFHLIDLRSGEPVRTSRTVAVVSDSATDAEVFSTAAAIAGPSAHRWLEAFPGCALGIFAGGETAPYLSPDFAPLWDAEPSGSAP